MADAISETGTLGAYSGAAAALQVSTAAAQASAAQLGTVSALFGSLGLGGNINTTA